MGLDHYDSNQFSRILWNIDYPNGYFRSFDRSMTEFNADFIAYVNKNFGDWALNGLAGATIVIIKQLSWGQVRTN